MSAGVSVSFCPIVFGVYTITDNMFTQLRNGDRPRRCSRHPTGCILPTLNCREANLAPQITGQLQSGSNSSTLTFTKKTSVTTGFKEPVLGWKHACDAFFTSKESSDRFDTASLDAPENNFCQKTRSARRSVLGYPPTMCTVNLTVDRRSTYMESILCGWYGRTGLKLTVFVVSF